jgi:hypothetical protein
MDSAARTEKERGGGRVDGERWKREEKWRCRGEKDKETEGGCNH